MNQVEVKRIVRNSPSFFTFSVEENMRPKLAWLRERMGLDAIGIRKLVGRSPRVLALKVCPLVVAPGVRDALTHAPLANAVSYDWPVSELLLLIYMHRITALPTAQDTTLEEKCLGFLINMSPVVYSLCVGGVILRGQVIKALVAGGMKGV